MEHQPDPIVLVEAHLDKVVAAAQRAELVVGLLLLAGGQLCPRSVVIQPLCRGPRGAPVACVVAAADAGGDNVCHASQQR